VCEEKNVAHQGAGGIALRERPDAILRALLEEKKRVEGRRGVGADTSELAGEGRAKGAMLRADSADVRNFVGENDGAGRR